MSHEHHHHHGEIAELKHVNKAFYVGIGLNFLFVIVEVIAGLIIHSLSLLSDAGHNFTDVISLALALLALRLADVKPSENFTYGYRKTTILVALFNSIILLVSIGAISYEAVDHLFNPRVLPGTTIAWVAGVGVIINGATAFMFLKNKISTSGKQSLYYLLSIRLLISLTLR